jgi:hypothetical protein
MLCMFICAFSLHEASPIDLEAMNPSFLGGFFHNIKLQNNKGNKKQCRKVIFQFSKKFYAR